MWISHLFNFGGSKGSRSLAKAKVDLRLANRAKVIAIAVETYELTLPNGLVIELENCYYVPSINKYIIYVSYLEKKCFCFIINNKCYSIYFDKMFYSSDY